MNKKRAAPRGRDRPFKEDTRFVLLYIKPVPRFKYGLFPKGYRKSNPSSVSEQARVNFPRSCCSGCSPGACWLCSVALPGVTTKNPQGRKLRLSGAMQTKKSRRKRDIRNEWVLATFQARQGARAGIERSRPDPRIRDR